MLTFPFVLDPHLSTESASAQIDRRAKADMLQVVG